ncbi:hypothetical protein F0562_019662 [Nyssa sinensis]|uniref:Uncharacterized protein n=1 Tax=Nyssa sinensis TaxID=561372 RepID=A0A5J5BP55_9ASTE|nr:hypothetical protein F0562_019662 [Nyssa sinensis]
MVKECGVDFVYDDEQEEKRSYPYNTDISCEQVIGGDLSRYQVPTGAYFLSHQYESDASDESDDVNHESDDDDDDGDPYNVYRTRRAFKESFFSIGRRVFASKFPLISVLIVLLYYM